MKTNVLSLLLLAGCASKGERLCDIQVECGVWPGRDDVEAHEVCIDGLEMAEEHPCSPLTDAAVDCFLREYRTTGECPDFNGIESCSSEKDALEECYLAQIPPQ